jgi:hypothetical protein
VDHTLKSLQAELQRTGIAVDVDVPEGVIVRGGFLELYQALRLLMLRAMRRSASGGEVSLTVVTQPQGVAIEVGDDGQTASHTIVDEEGLPMIAGRIDFQADRELDDVRHVMAGFGVTVVIQNCPQGGSAVTLWLPQRELRAVA